MNTLRMTPAELRAIIDAAGITTARAAEMACISESGLLSALAHWYSIPSPSSRLLCINLLFAGLATDLARPWVPDELAAVLAPKRAE